MITNELRQARKCDLIAHDFIEAIKELSSNQDALDNLECYLSWHFDEWLKTYANYPENITYELKSFAHIYDEVEE